MDSASSKFDQQFSILAALTCEARSFFGVRSCPRYCTIFGSIPGLYLLDTSSTSPPVVINKNDIPKYCQLSLGAQQSSLPTLRTTDLLKNIIIPHQRLCVLFLLGRLISFVLKVIFVHVLHMAHDPKSCWTQGTSAGKSILSSSHKKQVPCLPALNYFMSISEPFHWPQEKLSSMNCRSL